MGLTLETNSGKKGNYIREIEGLTLVKSGTNTGKKLD